VIEEPPFELGALHVNETLLLPPVAVFRLGAPGTVAGADGVALISFDFAPSPTEFTADTL
jgi:hypothetical protein